MHSATKRTIIAGAAIAAAGLFGSLPYPGTTVAQQDAPTVHRDVALVDVTSDAAAAAAATPDTIGAAELLYNSGIQTDIVAPNGFEDSLWTAFEPNGNAIFDSTGSGGIFPVAGDIGSVPVTVGGYLNVFDGGETQLYNAYLADTVAVEDEVNNLLGASSSDQAALFGALQTEYVGGLPTSVALGANFDSSLSALAGTDDQAALADFSTFTTYFLNNLASFASDGYLTEGTLTAEFAALDTLGMQIGTEFSTLLSSIFGTI